MTNSKNQIAQLLEPMLKLRLFAVISDAIAPADEILPHVVEHLNYMMDLEKKGILFASGPFVEPGVIVGAGLTILRAKNKEEATQYMDHEPLVRLGLRNYQIHEWELREGRMNVSVDFSSQRYQFT